MLAFSTFLILTILSTACRQPRNQIIKSDIEKAHGLVLPNSARNFQQLEIHGFTDRGILSMFEIAKEDISHFESQLNVDSSNGPTSVSIANPCANGWNVWPTNSATFVPGNSVLDGLKQTWTGGAKPIKMLSCRSSKGDWLHVEFWNVGDHALVKVYTDWN
jgi:hypothetical protein